MRRNLIIFTAWDYVALAGCYAVPAALVLAGWAVLS